MNSNNYLLAIASRTEQLSWAKQLLNLFDIRHSFHYEQIFPGSKLSHFNHLQTLSKIPYRQMFFFDDEHRNIKEVSTLGVCCEWINNGINKSIVYKYLEKGLNMV